MSRCTLALAAVLITAPALAAPAPRTFDLVTYAAPDGFTVQEQGGHVQISRIGTKSYCLIGIYASTDASADLDASFASEWNDIVNHSVDPVAAPVSQHATVGGAPAAVGAAMTTSGGKPVLAMLTTIDAGAKVVSIVVLTPDQDDLKVYAPSIATLMNGLAVKRIERASAPAAPPPAGDPPAEGKPIVAFGGEINLPVMPTGLSVADLDGEWKHDDSATTTYVTVATGAYAGYDAIQTKETWTFDGKKGSVEDDFLGVNLSSGGGYAVTEKYHFKAALGADGDLALTPTDSKNRTVVHYLVRGWQVGPDMTVLVVAGPFRAGGIPDDMRQDRKKGFNLDEVWVRKNKKTK